MTISKINKLTMVCLALQSVSAATLATSPISGSQQIPPQKQQLSKAIYNDWFHAIEIRNLNDVQKTYEKYPHIDVNRPDPETNSPPIITAISVNNEELVKFLCENTVTDLNNAKDNNGCTPLHWAAINGNLNILRLIMPKCHLEMLDTRDNKNFTPLDYAKQYNHQKIINFLTNLEKEEGHSPQPTQARTLDAGQSVTLSKTPKAQMPKEERQRVSLDAMGSLASEVMSSMPPEFSAVVTALASSIQVNSSNFNTLASNFLKTNLQSFNTAERLFQNPDSQSPNPLGNLFKNVSQLCLAGIKVLEENPEISPDTEIPFPPNARSAK
jgi:hypothetical protein